MSIHLKLVIAKSKGFKRNQKVFGAEVTKYHMHITVYSQPLRRFTLEFALSAKSTSAFCKSHLTETEFLFNYENALLFSVLMYSPNNVYFKYSC